MLIYSSIITLVTSITMFITCYEGCKRIRKKRFDPEYLSSDEQDDKKFLYDIHNPYGENGRQGMEIEPQNPLQALR